MKTKTKDHFRNSKCLHVHDRNNFPQVAELASENGQLKEELLETQQMLTELRIKNQRLEKQASLSYFLIGQTIRWKQRELNLPETTSGFVGIVVFMIIELVSV